jgi:hypothetical protein
MNFLMLINLAGYDDEYSVEDDLFEVDEVDYDQNNTSVVEPTEPGIATTPSTVPPTTTIATPEVATEYTPEIANGTDTFV